MYQYLCSTSRYIQSELDVNRNYLPLSSSKETVWSSLNRKRHKYGIGDLQDCCLLCTSHLIRLRAGFCGEEAKRNIYLICSIEVRYSIRGGE